MLSALLRWIERRKEIRRRWQADAAMLIARDERNAYYEAQRRAARHRAHSDGAGFVHWAKVAAEVARQSSVADMELSEVQRIVDEELARRS